jgi:hypothetical protein
MKITNKNSIVQALANVRLEGLSVSKEIEELLYRGLTDPSIDTEYILNKLRNTT